MAGWFNTFVGAINLSFFADIIGIAGAVFSLLAWRKTTKLRNEIYQSMDFNKRRKNILADIKAIRDGILLDENFTLQIASRLRTNMLDCERRFDQILNRKDKKTIRSIMDKLDTYTKNEDINTRELCSQLDYLTVKLSMEEKQR